MSMSLSYMYCSDPTICIVTCGIIPAFGIGITALLPMTYLLQASFFLSQQIFNITSYNISQCAIPRLYAGKIGFICCLMFTSFGMGLFVYDQLIMILINPNNLSLYPENEVNDLQSVMDNFQMTILITGILMFCLLILANLLVYLSSITPKRKTSFKTYERQKLTENLKSNASPLINYKYIQSSPQQKRTMVTSKSFEYENIESPSTLQKVNETPYEIQSSLRRKQLHEIRQKFESLKSPKLTYLKYILDAGNNINDLLPSPINTPGLLYHKMYILSMF